MCPELRADWRGRSDAEDVANRHTGSMSLCFLERSGLQLRSCPCYTPMARSMEPTLNL